MHGLNIERKEYVELCNVTCIKRCMFIKKKGAWIFNVFLVTSYARLTTNRYYRIFHLNCERVWEICCMFGVQLKFDTHFSEYTKTMTHLNGTWERISKIRAENSWKFKMKVKINKIRSKTWEEKEREETGKENQLQPRIVSFEIGLSCALIQKF